MPDVVSIIKDFAKYVGWQGPFLISLATLIALFHNAALADSGSELLKSAAKNISLMFLVLGVVISTIPVMRSWMSSRDEDAIRIGASAAIIGGTLGAALGYGWPAEYQDGVVAIEHSPRLLRIGVVLMHFLIVGPIIALYSSRVRALIDSHRRGRIAGIIINSFISAAVVSILVAMFAPDIGDPGIKFGQIIIAATSFSTVLLALILVHEGMSINIIIRRSALVVILGGVFYFILGFWSVPHWGVEGENIAFRDLVMNVSIYDPDAPTYFLGLTDADMSARLRTLFFVYSVSLASILSTAVLSSRLKVVQLIDGLKSAS